MEFKFKFEIGETVKLKNSEKSGEVRGRKYEEFKHKASTSTMIRYYVNLGTYFNEWYDGDKLESLENFTFDKKFEDEFLDLLIDANLIVGNYDQVKALSETKKKNTN